jgi:hypothetical protein
MPKLKSKIMSSDGYMQARRNANALKAKATEMNKPINIAKETIKGLPEATKTVGKAIGKVITYPGRMIGKQLDKAMDFREKMASPQTQQQIDAAKKFEELDAKYKHLKK